MDWLHPTGFAGHGRGIIRNNRVRYLDGATGNFTGYAIQVSSAETVVVSGNIVETIPSGGEPIRLEGCVNVTWFDNRTADGELIARIDPETEKAIEEVDVPAEDALVLACFEKS
jgi:hypothetical protein